MIVRGLTSIRQWKLAVLNAFRSNSNPPPCTGWPKLIHRHQLAPLPLTGHVTFDGSVAPRSP